MNVSKFRSSFKREPAKTSNFEVLVVPPLSLFTSAPLAGIHAPDLTFRADRAEMPGKQVQTFDYRDYGPPRRIASGAVYTDASLEFIVAEEMKTVNFFRAWQALVTGDQGQVGGVAVHAFGENDVSYYKNYVGNVIVVNTDREGKPSYVTVLHDAFPLNVAPIGLDWGAHDDIVRLRVDFAYYKFSSGATTVDGIMPSLPNIPTSVSSLLKFPF